jgi:hypothetical protein
MRTEKLIFVLMTLLLSGTAWAQMADSVSVDSVESISFSASIDTYFHKSINTKENAPRTSFSNLPGFSLGMVNLVLEYSGSRAGFVTDLVMGPRGNDAIFNAPRYKNAAGGGSSQMINQLYVYFLLNDRVQLNAGQFNTFVGYESIAASKNMNYSTSYIFSFGPFNHTGVWADIKLSDHCAAKLALMNPTDYTEFNPFGLYTVGGQLSVNSKKCKLNLNLTYGDPDGQLESNDSIGSVTAGNALHADLAASVEPAKWYSAGVSTSFRTIGSGQMKTSTNENASIEKCGYFGAALYQTFTITRSAKITTRLEYFTEHHGGIGAIGAYTTSGRASVAAVTISGNLTRANLRLIPEVRIDKTSTRSFVDSETGSAISQMISLNVALIYQLPAIVHKIKI